jgi:hypothetical protein
MKNWFMSLSGTISLTLLTLLVFLGRTFIDFYYVYGEFRLNVGMISGVILIHMALFGGWILGLLYAVKGSRRGLIAVFSINLFFLLFIAVGTLVSYCPSPCRTGWPVGEIAIWASLIAGLLATISLGIQIWQSTSTGSTDHLKVEAA